MNRTRRTFFWKWCGAAGFLAGVCTTPMLSGCNPAVPLDLSPPSNQDTPSPPVDTTDPPSPRGGAPAVWVAAQRRMVLFGGMFPITADTFSFDADSGVWQALTPEERGLIPGARCHHTLISDTENNHILLFGGFSFVGRFNDVWRFDPIDGRWIELFPGGDIPARRCLHTAAYIASRKEMLVYGGIAGAGVRAADFFDDTHLFDINRNKWMLVDAAGPGKLAGAISFYSTRDDAVYLWGGRQVDNYPTTLWRFDVETQTWSSETTRGDVPRGREDPAYFWDDARGKLYLFSGRNDSQPEILLEDSFELDLVTRQWKRLTPRTTPPARWRPSVAFDPQTNQGWMFGGWRDFGGRDAFNDTWLFDGAAPTWNRL